MDAVLVDIILLVVLVAIGIVMCVIAYQDSKWKRQFRDLCRRDRDERR